MRRDERRHFLIDSIKCLCDHGGLHTTKARKGKYIPGNLYNQIKVIFIKDWKEKRLLGLYSSEYINKFTNRDISESNIKCENCTIQLRNDTLAKIRLLKELHIIVKALNKIDNEPGYCIFGFCKK